MPSYTYECENPNCRHQFTKIAYINDDHNNVNCPKCGVKAKRIFVPTSTIWKCSGAFGKSK